MNSPENQSDENKDFKPSTELPPRDELIKKLSDAQDATDGEQKLLNVDTVGNAHRIGEDDRGQFMSTAELDKMNKVVNEDYDAMSVEDGEDIKAMLRKSAEAQEARFAARAAEEARLKAEVLNSFPGGSSGEDPESPTAEEYAARQEYMDQRIGDGGGIGEDNPAEKKKDVNDDNYNEELAEYYASRSGEDLDPEIEERNRKMDEKAEGNADSNPDLVWVTSPDGTRVQKSRAELAEKQAMLENPYANLGKSSETGSPKPRSENDPDFVWVTGPDGKREQKSRAELAEKQAKLENPYAGLGKSGEAGGVEASVGDKEKVLEKAAGDWFMNLSMNEQSDVVLGKLDFPDDLKNTETAKGFRKAMDNNFEIQRQVRGAQTETSSNVTPENNNVDDGGDDPETVELIKKNVADIMAENARKARVEGYKMDGRRLDDIEASVDGEARKLIEQQRADDERKRAKAEKAEKRKKGGIWSAIKGLFTKKPKAEGGQTEKSTEVSYRKLSVEEAQKNYDELVSAVSAMEAEAKRVYGEAEKSVNGGMVGASNEAIAWGNEHKAEYDQLRADREKAGVELKMAQEAAENGENSAVEAGLDGDGEVTDESVEVGEVPMDQFSDEEIRDTNVDEATGEWTGPNKALVDYMNSSYDRPSNEMRGKGNFFDRKYPKSTHQRDAAFSNYRKIWEDVNNKRKQPAEPQFRVIEGSGANIPPTDRSNDVLDEAA